MHEDEGTVEGMERRSFLKRSAIVAGATVWATPTVQSLMAPAFATGTGRCPDGALYRFKAEVDEETLQVTGYSNGVPASGSEAAGCLPDGYAEATPLDGACLPGTTMCVSVVVTGTEGNYTATVTLPDGWVIEDLDVKAGSSNSPQVNICEDATLDGDNTASVTVRAISFVAGVICIPQTT